MREILKIIVISSFFFLFVGVGTTFSASKIISLEGGEYTMRMLTNNTTDFYQYDWAWHPEGTGTEKWGINQYHSLLVNFSLNYSNRINGICGIEFFANKVSYLPTVDREGEIDEEDNVGAVISKVDLNIYGDLFDTWIFRNVGHYHWGDIFGFYREMYETEWAKQCNCFTPEGVELNGKGIFNGLTVITGRDPIWGNSSEVFMKYEQNVGLTNVKLMYKEKLTETQTGDIDTINKEIKEQNIRNYDFNPWDDRMIAFSLGIGDKTPFSIEGEVKTVNADEKNIALGVKNRIKFIPTYIELLTQYINADVYAGNKEELYLEGRLSPVPFIILNGNYTNRKNVQSPTSAFPAIVLDNREGSIIKGSIILDTTPDVPFRLWDGRFNEEENAPLAIESGYEVADYTGHTDRQRHYDYEGEVWWEEEPDSQGRNPVKLDKLFTQLVLCPFENGDRIILKFDTGLKQATVGTDYVVEETTRFKNIELNTKIGFFRTKFQYFIDDWKPYQIDGPVYGMAYDERYIVYLGRVFDPEEKLKIGLEYEEVKDEDKTLEYREYRIICSLKF